MAENASFITTEDENVLLLLVRVGILSVLFTHFFCYFNEKDYLCASYAL